jgi:hypothetical protein
MAEVKVSATMAPTPGTVIYCLVTIKDCLVTIKDCLVTINGLLGHYKGCPGKKDTGSRNHHLPAERRCAREGADDGRARVAQDHQAL